MKEIKELFERWIKHWYSPTDVFDDFLNVTILSIIDINKTEEYEENEKTYERIIKKYGGDVEMFSKILACFVKKMEETQETLKDRIGQYFMEVVSHGEHWQFFTPDHIAHLCAETTISKMTEEKKFPSYMDCACGSSRMLLQAQRIKRGKSYGTDIDRRCVLMSVFNHLFYGLIGCFTVWNALMNERREVFEVMPPFIYHKSFN